MLKRFVIPFLFIVLLVWSMPAAATVVRVGVYDGLPLIGVTPQGEGEGLFIDLLKAAAHKEGWQLHYVFGTWSEVLQMVESGQIDVLPAVGYTAERARRMDFEEVPVLSNWGIIFTGSGTRLRTILDLDGKTVAVLRDDVYDLGPDGLRRLAQRFNIHPQYLPVDSYRDVAAAVRDGRADAGLSDRFVFDRSARSGLVKTPILVSPIGLHFAFSKGTNASLREALDRELEAWKSDRGSVYYQSIDRWLGQEPLVAPPQWLWPVMFVLAAILTILAAAVFLARYRIRRVTAEVVERNRRLQEEVVERQRAESELRKQENQLRTLIDNVNALVYIKDTGGRYQLVNRRFEDIIGISPERVLGRTDSELFPERAEQYTVHDREVFVSGKPLQCEETTVLDGSPRTFLSAKVPLFDAAGSLYALCGVSSDITEQKTAAQTVAEERSFLQAVIDGVVDPIMVIGLDHRVLMMNKAVRSHLPQDVDPASTFCHQVSAQFRFPCEDHKRSCLLTQVQASGQPLTIARRQTFDDGESHILEVDVSPLWGRDGTMQGVIEVSRDITDRLRNEERLQENEVRLNYLVYHDALTELPNRVLFNDRLHQALGKARRQSEQVAILFLDLDRFKNINDSLGHEIGDQVLMEVAKRLRYWARESDTVARLGGDEFLLILEDIHDVTYVAMFANKILGILAQPVVVESHELYITGSLGISLFPADGATSDALLKAADAAMYKAKEEGKNTYQFYTPDMNARAHELLLMEGDLRKALEFEQLVLHYQPQFELDGGKLLGMEALVRWRHPRRGLVPPGDFIPLAEETGLIVPLGEWVLRHACLQNRAWQRQGLPPVRVAVNISARQFRQPDFVDLVDRILAETGLAPEWLELEITESIVMEDFGEAIMTLTDLKVRGIHLSIDDFGTGYSSLSYLKRFPISKLKIDQAFVRDVTVDANDAAIAASVIALAQSMNLEVIAEGVETEAQLHFLLEKGCRQGQGFLLGRPLPAEQAEHFFKGKEGG